MSEAGKGRGRSLRTLHAALIGIELELLPGQNNGRSCPDEAADSGAEPALPHR